MLKKALAAMAASLLLTIVTYHLPFVIKQKVEVHSETTSSQSDEVRELLKKEELSEEEFRILKEHSESLLEQAAPVDMQDKAIHASIRRGTIYWLSFTWLLFFVFLPNSPLLYLLSLIFPALYFVTGQILDIELACIIGSAIIVLSIKTMTKPRGQAR